MKGGQGLDIYFQAAPILTHLEDTFPSFMIVASLHYLSMKHLDLFPFLVCMNLLAFVTDLGKLIL